MDKQIDVSFIWDHLPKCEEYPEERRQTAWGTKTKEGLSKCIMRLVKEAEIEFDNSWMRLITKPDGKRFIKSDDKYFELIQVATTQDRANKLMEDDDSIGLIATDQFGKHYLAKLEATNDR